MSLVGHSSSPMSGKEPSKSFSKNQLNLSPRQTACVRSGKDWEVRVGTFDLEPDYGSRRSPYETPTQHWSPTMSWTEFELRTDSQCAFIQKTILWASARGDSALLSFCLTQSSSELSFVNQYGQTPLSLAAEHGNESIVELLLARDDIDVNLPDQDGQSPLAWAAFQGHSCVVDRLLEQDDVDADTKDVDGNTALAWAATKGHYTVVVHLLERLDVQISPVNRWRQTPRDLAVANGHREIANLLSMWIDDTFLHSITHHTCIAVNSAWTARNRCCKPTETRSGRDHMVYKPSVAGVV